MEDYNPNMATSNNTEETMATKTKQFWIARNKNGGLYLYRTKPKIANVWDSVKEKWVERPWFDGEEFAELKATSFKEITWENSPQKVSVTIDIISF